MTFEDGGKKAFVELPGADPKDEPKKIEIKIGISDGLNVEIVSGLKKGRQGRGAAAEEDRGRLLGDRCLRVQTFRDALRQLLRDMRSQKLRTFLTVFGIVWGTVAISLLLAFGGACTSRSSRTRPASATASSSPGPG